MFEVLKNELPLLLRATILLVGLHVFKVTLDILRSLYRLFSAISDD